MLIRSAYMKALCGQPERRGDKYLWVSELGSHPYAAMDRILNGTRKEFGIETRDKMQQGNALEADTFALVGRQMGNIMFQVPFYNDIWSGYADAVIDYGGGSPIIIEHKATDATWWAKYETVKAQHCAQLYLYGQLYFEKFGIMPRLILYYRSWGKYAEVEINTYDRHVEYSGYKDDKPYGGVVAPLCLNALREEIERYYVFNQMPPTGDIPVDSFDYATLRSAEICP